MINDDELAGVSEKPSESLSNCDASKVTFETLQDQPEGVAPQENATVCDSPAEPEIQPVPLADCPDPASAESDRVDPSATADPSFAASSSLDAIVLEIGQLRASFDEKLRYDGSRDAIIARLHAELQKHKA